uniref:Zinc transporter 1 n=1 Tax=Phallusia mammillata TaxID=59560 RepID=A0A6F9DTB2_9ASCI|nr:zinc transporter 1 [Phallusia mammillata]
MSSKETSSVESTMQEDCSLINGQMHEDKEEENEEDNGICSRWIKSKSIRLGSMLSLILVYFLAEVLVGHITNSLTLVADSFHMLSDCLSLIVALVAVRMSKRTAHESITPWPSKRRYYNTFGWVRFEVVGALINSTFLLALCVSILMEAVEKFYEPKLVTNAVLVLAVGGGGLLINIIGLILFGSHAHAGHDHGHGHGHDHGHDHKHSHSHDASLDVEAAKNGAVAPSKQDTSMEEQMNMKAVFLHVLGDALGSVIVIVSATVMMLVPHEPIDVPATENATAENGTFLCPSIVVDELNIENRWILYLDPVMSLLLVLIMIFTTVPLFKQSSLILLQTVPNHIQLDDIRDKIEKIEGVQEIHDFHIWQLTGEKLVATVHLQCKDADTYLSVAKIVKKRLHDSGIHSSTVQPEFHTSPAPHCNMQCQTEACKTKTCCSINGLAKRSSNTSPTVGVEADTKRTPRKSNSSTSSSKQYSPEQNSSPGGVVEVDDDPGLVMTLPAVVENETAGV